MDYEIVNLKEKTAVGLKVRTSNLDDNMPTIIGGLWQKFYGEGIFQSIPNKVNQNSIGLYTNYESDDKGAYDLFVCSEVSSAQNLPENTVIASISGGKYAKFVIHGDVQKAVADLWTKLWDMDLDRKFDCDFEEYISGTDTQNAEIHIYISLND